MNLRKRTAVPFYGHLRLNLLVLENFNDFVSHKWPETFKDMSDVECCHGVSHLEWPDAWLVFRSGDINHEVIAHENQHVVLRVIREIGIIECRESEEAYCYFMGWLANYVYSTLQKNNVKVGIK